MHTTDLVFHPARPVELDGLVVLRSDAVVTFAGAAKRDHLNVAYPMEPDGVLVFKPRTLRATLRCADLALVEHSFSNREGPERNAIGQVWLRPRTGISRVPGGPLFAHTTEDDDVGADVLGRKGVHLRVAIGRETDTLFGWVSASTTEPSELNFGFAETIGYGAGTVLGIGCKPDVVTCPRDVPLFAARGALPENVGFVRAGREMALDRGDETHFAVRFPGKHAFSELGETPFLVRKDALAACSGAYPEGG